MKKSFALLALGLLLVSCGNKAEEEMGVVARVNGKPILLSQLEFQHDMVHLDNTMTAPTVAVLKKEYGQILGQLIILELVSQEMHKRDLSPTEADLQQAEAKIRADYPEGVFDHILVEEYIDIESWRRQLRNHLTLERFFQQVLRPQIRIDYKEAEDYYAAHTAEFTLPARVRLYVIVAPEKELVDKTLDRYRQAKDLTVLTGRDLPATAREITVRVEQLPDPWRDALARLQPGQNTAILHDESGYQSLVLAERLAPTELTPTQAYPLIEQTLAEVKLQEAFERWLQAKLADAKIVVSAHLLPKAEDALNAVDEKRQQQEMELLGQHEEGEGERLGASGQGTDEVILAPGEDLELDQGDLEEEPEAPVKPGRPAKQEKAPQPEKPAKTGKQPRP